MAGRPPMPGQYPPMPPQPYQRPGMPGGPMPGQQPGYGPRPMPAAGNSNSLIIVVVVVVVAVVVLVAIVIPALTYIAVTSTLPPTTPQNPTMVLQGSNTGPSNFSFTVSAISSSNVDPAQLTYLVEASGITYYSGAADNSIVTTGVTVNVIFNDNLDMGHVSAGDAIRVTTSGSTNPLHGGSFKVFFSNAAISTATIP